MPEAGGPTTQSGILYQNSIAALFLGRLCDTASRPDYEKVISIRVEAPEKVDDIVVRFADDHKLFIQAKENVTVGDDVWKKLWWDFEAQFHEINFIKGKDRLSLWVGNNNNEFIDLREICERSTSSLTYEDWQKKCNKAQKTLLEKIKGFIHPELLYEPTLLHFFQHLVIEIHPSQTMERDEINLWMPSSNFPPITLFRLLRDRVGGESRIRGEFTSNSLLKQLIGENPSLTFPTPPDIGNFKESIKACSSILRQQKSTIGNTGLHFSREIVNDIVEWSIESSDAQNNVAMLIDKAGVGKTVALHDVQDELESKGIDVIAIKADQQLSGITQLKEIQTRLCLLESPEQILGRLAQLGRVVVLIDQIDALSLSLAHDQATLDIILDLIARLRRIPNLRIVISCRTFDKNNDQRLRQIDIPQEFTLTELTDDEVTKFLNSIGISFQDLPEPTKVLLKNPLNLNLFVLALSNVSIRKRNLLGVTSLQELYGAIWDNILLQDDSQAPLKADRLQVIKLFTEYMSGHQVINVPKTYLHHIEMKHLEKTISWLASVGILVESNTNWVFIHQTFFDYCYARDFVEREKNLVEVIQQSDQGIFVRPLLLQVMAFMRGTNSKQFITTLAALLSSPEIRYHLRDLLLNWFGSLSDPTDDEWILAQRMLIVPEKKPYVLKSMFGNSGWFARLRSTFLPNWLNEQVIDDSLLLYIVSVGELNDIQLDVFTLLKPFVGKNEDWNNRLARIVSQIRKWHSCEAVEFYQHVILNLSNLNRIDVYQIGEISKLFPKSGVSLLRFLLDFTLNQYEKSDTPNSSSFSIYDLLRILENNDLGEAFHIVSEAEPKLFLEAILPWLYRVISFRDVPEEPSPFYFVGDQFSWGWYDEHESIEHSIIFSIIYALVKVAKSDSLYFTGVAQSLSQSPYRTPQLILVRTFLGLSTTYQSYALSFLLSDRRRLDLGDIDAYDSRQLIQAIYPVLSSEKQCQLEEFILQPPLIDIKRGLDGLHWRGIEQLHLLQSIPQEFLSDKAKRQQVELEHKFPNSIPVTNPATMISGTIISPISDEIAKRMSDRQWILAMNKYRGDVTHKDFLKGGSRQLSTVLQSLTKEDPERYFGLLQQVNNDVDDNYVRAFLNGFAESSSSFELLLYTIRRFSKDPNRNIKRTVAWSIEKRAKEEVPIDIIDLFYSYLQTSPGEDEWWWTKGEHNGDTYSSFLNSDRGASFSALMRIYDNQNSDEAKSKKWDLIEFIESDPSTALRIGAIHELTYMIRLDQDKATKSFTKLINGHEILLESMYTREFIYSDLYKNYLAMYPFIVSFMHYPKDEVKEQGAQLACIGGISTAAMESETALNKASDLANQTLSSAAPILWKRGAATIYSHNVTGDSKDICIQRLIDLLNEEDTQIHGSISRVFYSLQLNQFTNLKDFVCSYVQKTRSNDHKFSEYLLDCGLVDSDWTLEIIRLYLNNPYLNQPSLQIGFEDIIRLVLRIYVDPTASEGIRKTSMDLFDILMEKFPAFSKKVLTEWDRR